jgi:hypothetical protein
VSIAGGRGASPVPRAALAALAICAALFSACGSASPSAVATVAGTPIANAQLAHWTAVMGHEAPPQNAHGATAAQRALAFLITALWLEKEAAARGLGVSAAEAKASYAAFVAALPPGAFAAGLRRRGLAEADEIYRLRLERLALRVRAQLLAGTSSAAGAASARERTLHAFAASFTQRWKRVTVCAKGHVIAQCASGPALAPIEL